MRSRCSAGGTHRPVSLGGEAELLQRLDIELQHDRLRRVDQPHRDRGFEIGLVGVLVVELVRRQLVLPEAAIGDVALELMRVGCAAAAAARRRRRASRPTARCPAGARG